MWVEKLARKIATLSEAQFTDQSDELHVTEPRDASVQDVQNKQIMSALLCELGVKFVQPDGVVYAMLQATANEARKRHLLINPNPFTRATYSDAVGSTGRMRPSEQGWEMTKGILWRNRGLVSDMLMREELRRSAQA